MGDLVITGPRLTLRRRSVRPISVLRVPRADADACLALGAAFGLAWPTEPNSCARAKGHVLWQGPGEWLLIGFDPSEATARALMALPGALQHLSDQTDGLVTFRIEGQAMRALIAKGCGLDLHPRGFPPATCARSLMAQVEVRLHRPDSDDAFDIIVDASVATYFQRWLIDAAAEFTL